MLWLSQVLDCSPDWDIGQNGERLWDLRVGIWRVVMRVPHTISGSLSLSSRHHCKGDTVRGPHMVMAQSSTLSSPVL